MIISVLLLLLGLYLIAKGVYALLKGMYYLAIALYYRVITSESKIDEGYKKYVIKPSKENQDFERKIDQTIQELINPKSFRL